jgi:hypothetical protein
LGLTPVSTLYPLNPIPPDLSGGLASNVILSPDESGRFIGMTKNLWVGLVVHR